ncbi:hypothetical protein, partial [Actinomadura sp. WAC 06369]|uniref:hypothetical protein n=1 Tax=Actinomadura sp. WAC 06369 TaxID=2203193 RepID=UPI003FA36049
MSGWNPPLDPDRPSAHQGTPDPSPGPPAPGGLDDRVPHPGEPGQRGVEHLPGPGHDGTSRSR